MPNAINNVQEALLGVLNAHANSAGTGEQIEQRRESRRVVEVGCELCAFVGTTQEIVRIPAVTSNLTFNGISIVAELQWPLPEGQPVELIVNMPDNSKTHLAGLIVFCRCAAGKQYNLGVEVKASCSTMILIHDIQAARRTYSWFDEALAVAT